MRKRTLRDLDPRGKRVLVRVDYNVPLDKQGRITDDARIRASLPTLQYLLERECSLVLMSHLGRPKGKPEAKYSLKPAAERLSELLARPVELAASVVGPDVEEQASWLTAGQVLMLENLRFHPGEEANDDGLARQLASLADIYINDAFGAAHRAHASTAAVAKHAPSAAGFLLEKEIDYLSRVTESPERPFVAILGGAKVSDKIGVISNLGKLADKVLIGGAMAFTFYRARGAATGGSLVEEDKIAQAGALLAELGDKLVLPVDIVVAAEPKAGVFTRTVAWNAIPADQKGLDIGPESVALFQKSLSGAKTVVWNGPMGVFEVPEFASGTREVARLVAESGGTTVIGGGDSAAAISQLGFADRVSHVSTGGGASLEFLEGLELPGVAALNDRTP
ncbi:MAG: phosphoglycerate kinase [Candidatus Wallbacteria bacterium]|nr:phosphoglycerate kinase [Candidatus Wallbacteria bacterium]